MILDHPFLSQSEIKLLVAASQDSYENEASLEGWNAITPNLTNSSYGLSSELSQEIHSSVMLLMVEMLMQQYINLKIL